MTLLERFGFDAGFAAFFAPFAPSGLVPARVVREERGSLLVVTESGPRAAEVAGRLRHAAATRLEFPAVGDWVAVRLPTGEGPATVAAVLPRRSRIVRRAAGPATRPQVLAANVDALLAVMGLDLDFNGRRLERYVALAREAGAAPVVVLTKADACADVASRVAEAEAAAPGVPVAALSARAGTGLEALAPLLAPGRTLALLGMSGAGTSTLVNRLLGEDRQGVRAVRDSDGRGRHATTRRDLFLLPGGALLVDTPGMRELGLWAGPGDGAFPDVAALASACRYRDCSHGSEPGCAVREAAADGRLDPGRLASFEKLRREEDFLARRQDEGLARAERQRWKGLARAAKERSRAKRTIGP